LKRLDRENTDLDVNNLEKYLNEEDFEEAFGISPFAFRLLKPQDQKALVCVLLTFYLIVTPRRKRAQVCCQEVKL